MVGRASSVVAGAATLAVLLSGCGSDSELDPFAGVPKADSKPGLTKDEEAAARTIIDENAVLQDLLDGGRVDIRALGPWSERDAQGVRRSVGAIAVLRLPRPRDFAMRDWPVVSYDDVDGDCDSTGEHYREDTVEYSAEDVTGLQVSVDLNEQEVVGIEPTGGRVTPGLSMTTTAESSGC